jgi:hypothetical protein
MPTARSLVAALTLALTAISCSDKGPTEASNLGDNQTPSTAVAAAPLVFPNVTGTLQGGGTFVGTLTITEITRQGTQLVASGTLVGTATQGTTVTQITQSFVNEPITLQQQPGRRCQILFLDIGPIFLDLLGLEVSLSRIILDITAVAGPGNLLGNLLCALVGLLDRTPLNLTAIDQLLNQINAILRGLAG